MAYHFHLVRVQPSFSKEITADYSSYDKMKYLGVWFDANLKWNHHFDHIKTEVAKSTNILCSLSGVKRGSDPKVLCMVHSATVKSHFDYASSLFALPPFPVYLS